jgi:antitoxin component YwqK of YwqJK toxin-antitoxin module
LLEGSKKSYYENNSKLLEESTYSKGLREGVAKYYDTEGKLIAEYNYKNGKFEGTNKTYYTSGNVQSEEICVDNLKTGVYKEYFDSTPAKIKIMGNYVNDKKDGKWQEFDETGKLIKTSTFVKGVEK